MYWCIQCVTHVIKIMLKYRFYWAKDGYKSKCKSSPNSETSKPSTRKVLLESMVKKFHFKRKKRRISSAINTDLGASSKGLYVLKTKKNETLSILLKVLKLTWKTDYRTFLLSFKFFWLFLDSFGEISCRYIGNPFVGKCLTYSTVHAIPISCTNS